jgi:hypothetical protein
VHASVVVTRVGCRGGQGLVGHVLGLGCLVGFLVGHGFVEAVLVVVVVELVLVVQLVVVVVAVAAAAAADLVALGLLLVVCVFCTLRGLARNRRVRHERNVFHTEVFSSGSC